MLKLFRNTNAGVRVILKDLSKNITFLQILNLNIKAINLHSSFSLNKTIKSDHPIIISMPTINAIFH